MEIGQIRRAADLAEVYQGLAGRTGGSGIVAIEGLQGTPYPQVCVPVDLADETIELVLAWAAAELAKLGVEI